MKALGVLLFLALRINYPQSLCFAQLEPTTPSSYNCSSSVFLPTQHFYTLARFLELLDPIERFVANSDGASATNNITLQQRKHQLLAVISYLNGIGRIDDSSFSVSNNKSKSSNPPRLPDDILNRVEICQLQYFLVHKLAKNNKDDGEAFETGVVQLPHSHEAVVIQRVLAGINAGLLGNPLVENQGEKLISLYAGTLAGYFGTIVANPFQNNAKSLSNTTTTKVPMIFSKRLFNHRQSNLRRGLSSPLQMRAALQVINLNVQPDSSKPNQISSIKFEDVEGHFVGATAGCPSAYVVQTGTKHSVAELRGAVDGFILGKIIRHLLVYYPANVSTRISRILWLYYTHGLPMSEITDTERIRACNRGRWLRAMLELDKLEQQVVAYTRSMLKVAHSERLRTNLEINARSVLGEFRRKYLQNGQNESWCDLVDGGQQSSTTEQMCSSNVDLYIVVDSACPSSVIFARQKQFVQQLLSRTTLGESDFIAIDGDFQPFSRDEVATASSSAMVMQYADGGDVHVVIDKKLYATASSQICRATTLRAKNETISNDGGIDYAALMDSLARRVVARSQMATRQALVVQSICRHHGSNNNGNSEHEAEIGDMISYFLSLLPPQLPLLYILTSLSAAKIRSVENWDLSTISTNPLHKIHHTTIFGEDDVSTTAKSLVGKFVCTASPVELYFNTTEQSLAVAVRAHRYTKVAVNVAALENGLVNQADRKLMLILQPVDFTAQIAVEYRILSSSSATTPWIHAEQTQPQQFIIFLPKDPTCSGNSAFGTCDGGQALAILKITGIRYPLYTHLNDRWKFDANWRGEIFVHIKLVAVTTTRPTTTELIKTKPTVELRSSSPFMQEQETLMVGGGKRLFNSTTRRTKQNVADTAIKTASLNIVDNRGGTMVVRKSVDAAGSETQFTVAVAPSSTQPIGKPIVHNKGNQWEQSLNKRTTVTNQDSVGFQYESQISTTLAPNTAVFSHVTPVLTESTDDMHNFHGGEWVNLASSTTVSAAQSFHSNDIRIDGNSSRTNFVHFSFDRGMHLTKEPLKNNSNASFPTFAPTPLTVFGPVLKRRRIVTVNESNNSNVTLFHTTTTAVPVFTTNSFVVVFNNDKLPLPTTPTTFATIPNVENPLENSFTATTSPKTTSEKPTSRRKLIFVTSSTGLFNGRGEHILNNVINNNDSQSTNVTTQRSLLEPTTASTPSDANRQQNRHSISTKFIIKPRQSNKNDHELSTNRQHEESAPNKSACSYCTNGISLLRIANLFVMFSVRGFLVRNTL